MIYKCFTLSLILMFSRVTIYASDGTHKKQTTQESTEPLTGGYYLYYAREDENDNNDDKTPPKPGSPILFKDESLSGCPTYTIAYRETIPPYRQKILLVKTNPQKSKL